MYSIDIISILEAVLFILGIMLFFTPFFPPLFLINDENREEKEKQLTNTVNWDNMSWKQRLKMFLMLILGFVLLSISFLLQFFTK